MTVDEISRLAINGHGIDLTEPCEDRCLYYELADIYRQFRNGMIGQADGTEKKNQAVRRHQIEHNAAVLRDDILSRHNRLYTAIESASSECRKNPCRDTAIRLLDALYGVGMSVGAVSSMSENNQAEGAF